jgi:hypothetical protein
MNSAAGSNHTNQCFLVQAELIQSEVYGRNRVRRRHRNARSFLSLCKDDQDVEALTFQRIRRRAPKRLDFAQHDVVVFVVANGLYLLSPISIGHRPHIDTIVVIRSPRDARHGHLD